MSLDRYQQKRDFTRTPEPRGDRSEATRAASTGGRFVVQRHRASRLHYDFRLEIGGVLVSWAVPKGPTLDPAVRRGAFKVEDHPLGYFDFEGTIPRGEYGAGDVIVWDWGRFEPELAADPGEALADGELKFSLRGQKLNGRFTIVRTGGRPGSSVESDDAWLLIKKRDEAAVAGWDPEAHPHSVKTGRTNAEVAGGRAAPPSEPLPDFIEPMTATLGSGPFSHPDWLFEVKWDGYRVQAHVEGGRVALYTRRGLDAAEYFPELAGSPDWIAAHRAIVDGEVVALDSNGEPDFGLLQARRAATGHAAGREPGSGLVYAVFDILHLDGRSLLDEPLETRKRILRSVLREVGPVQYAGHVVGDGVEFYAAVAARGLEGMMAKLRTSRYEPGRRSASWLKIKRRLEQEFVVAGWKPREGSDDDLGALVLAVYEDGRLRPVGKVGTGFDTRERARLVGPLRALTVAPPLPGYVAEAGLRWVEPRLVARVEFSEWTSDGRLRAPVYKGLEIDADPARVTRESPASSVAPAAPTQVPRGRARPRAPAAAVPEAGTAVQPASSQELETLDALPARGGVWSVGGHELKLSNLDKQLWPDGTVKRDLIRYYAGFAPLIVPYLAGRALTLQRFPDGVDRPGFWQKQLPGHAPSWIGRWSRTSRSHGEATDYMLADSAAALAWIANEAAIDIHPSTYLVAAPDRPTWALVDVDPGPRTTWDETLLLVRLYRTALGHLGVRGFPKLSGQRGIQIWIPIKPVYAFDETREWVAALSRTVAAAAPGLISWEWEKSRRDGLARLDYTQNAWNKTLVAPYSVRPVSGATVSAPIDWDELDDPELRPNRWTIASIGDRVARRGDLFAPALTIEQELPRLG